MKKFIYIIAGILIIIGINFSCKEDNENPEASRNCVVKLVKNIAPLTVGDTLALEAAPGTLLQNVPVLTKTGKTFDGWYTDQSFIAASAFNIATTPVYLDKILYAKWK